MRAVYGALWGLVVSGASGCLLFTDDINMPPMISIDGPTNVRRGPMHMFQARLNESPATTTVDWRHGATCPADLETAMAVGSGNAAGRGTSTMLQFTNATPGPACVWAVARDGRGALGLATKSVTVQDPKLTVMRPSSVAGGEKTLFTATYASEPDTRADFYWGRSTSGCSDARNAALLESTRPPRDEGANRSTYEIPAPFVSFCVAVLARDGYGVQAQAEVMVDPADGELAIVRAAPAGDGPVPVFSQVRLSAGAQGKFLPTQVVQFQWKLTGPSGAALTPVNCEGASPAGVAICLQVPDVGNYRAELTLMDGAAARPARPLDFKVEDGPPCIRETSPSFLESPRLVELYDVERVFRVLTVEDDGDPLPPPGHQSVSAFIWSIKRAEDTEFRRLVNATSRDYVIRAREYRPGDKVDVRVEYRDRVGVGDDNARSLAGCNPAERTCGVQPGSTCYQRVSWTVEYR